MPCNHINDSVDVVCQTLYDGVHIAQPGLGKDHESALKMDGIVYGNWFDGGLAWKYSE